MIVRKLEKICNHFFQKVFDLVSEKIDEFEFELTSVAGYNKGFIELWDDLTSEKLNHIYWAMEDNKLDLMTMNEIIVDLVGRQNVELYELLPKNYSGPSECKNYCLYMKREIIKGFIKADLLVSLAGLGLGTMLRQFSDRIGYAFENVPILPYNAHWSKCEMGEVENLIFETMKKLAPQFGMKGSLHDIPNVFASGYNTPVAQFYPLFSVCSLGFEDICTHKLVSKSHLM